LAGLIYYTGATAVGTAFFVGKYVGLVVGSNFTAELFKHTAVVLMGRIAGNVFGEHLSKDALLPNCQSAGRIFASFCGGGEEGKRKWVHV
jgi:hypothetical protein